MIQLSGELLALIRKKSMKCSNVRFWPFYNTFENMQERFGLVTWSRECFFSLYSPNSNVFTNKNHVCLQYKCIPHQPVVRIFFLLNFFVQAMPMLSVVIIIWWRVCDREREKEKERKRTIYVCMCTHVASLSHIHSHPLIHMKKMNKEKAFRWVENRARFDLIPCAINEKCALAEKWRFIECAIT